MATVGVLTQEQIGNCVNFGVALVMAEVATNYQSIPLELASSSLLQVLGAACETECVVISRISEMLILEGLSEWWIPLLAQSQWAEGVEPEFRRASLVERARAKLAWEYCCQVSGVVTTFAAPSPAFPPVPPAPAQESAVATLNQQVLQEQLQLLQAMHEQLRVARAPVADPLGLATGQPGPLPPPAASSRRIKLKELVDEFNEDECGLMSDVELARCYAVYEAVYGKDERPEEEEELTHEQLSALSFLLKQGCVSVNFNVFGPHGHRTIRRVKLQGQFFHQDGTLHRVELLGPATFEMWLASWSVFQHGLMMLEAVELGRLTAYRKHQERMHRRYGAALWPLQFQVEKRTRDELFPRIKRDGYAAFLKKKKDVEDAGMTWDQSMHPFNPNKPWDYVFWKVMHETNSSWWMQQFEIPALRIPQTHKRVADFIEGDAPIGQAASAGRATTAVADPYGHSAPPPPPAAHHDARPKKKARTTHNVVDGHFQTTKTNVPICPGFNAGTCTTTVQGSWCGVDSSKMHLCSKCLQPRHTAQNCQNTPAVASKGHTGKGKGKGSKKGHGKGKKGWGY